MPAASRPETTRPKKPVVARPLPAGSPSGKVSDEEATKRAKAFAADDARHGQTPAFMRDTARLPIIAKRFGVSLTKVYDWLELGLPSFRIGREHLVHVPTADEWVKAKLTGQPFNAGDAEAKPAPIETATT